MSFKNVQLYRNLIGDFCDTCRQDIVKSEELKLPINTEGQGAWKISVACGCTAWHHEQEVDGDPVLEEHDHARTRAAVRYLTHQKQYAQAVRAELELERRLIEERRRITNIAEQIVSVNIQSTQQEQRRSYLGQKLNDLLDLI